MPSRQSQLCHMAGKHPGRLTQSQVQRIYLAKKPGIRATKIAGSFGVNEKTVRDIWSGRTWSKETLHLSDGVSKSSGSPYRMIKPKGTILKVQLATDHQALRPDQNHDRGYEIKFENIGQRYDEREHSFDPGFTSVDEQLWKWDEAIWFDLCSSDPFKLDWKPRPCVD